jgi:C1A family cysteine protease
MPYRVLLSVHFFFFFCAFSFGEKPWAASQPLSALTGLKLPSGWENQAPWKKSFAVSKEELPEFYDWRFYAHGLTPVKQQAANDCWAQGTIGVLESLVKIHLRLETDLSVQQVISCSGSGSARSGGYFANDYLVKKGAVSSGDYPYVGRDTVCKKSLRPLYRLSRWGYVGSQGSRPTTTEMKQAIMEHGPIGVTLTANSALQNFQGSGVFSGCAKGQTNHIEVIVGWDDTEGGGVWFVRNSWGPTHGDDGYAKIPYNCSRIGEMATWADLELP